MIDQHAFFDSEDFPELDRPLFKLEAVDPSARTLTTNIDVDGDITLNEIDKILNDIGEENGVILERDFLHQDPYLLVELAIAPDSPDDTVIESVRNLSDMLDDCHREAGGNGLTLQDEGVKIIRRTNYILMKMALSQRNPADGLPLLQLLVRDFRIDMLNAMIDDEDLDV